MKSAVSRYNKVIKRLSFSVACLVSFFAPFQMGCIDMQGMCCAGCAIKKEEEEDRIEVIINQNKDE